MRLDMTGIEVRHQRGCPARDGKRCKCDPSYRATAYVDGMTIRETFDDPRLAADWRHEAGKLKAQGRLRPSDKTPIRDHMERLLTGIEAGSVAARGGHTYKPSVVAGYRRQFTNYLDDAFGAMPAGALRRDHIKAFVAQLRDPKRDDGPLTSSTIRNVLMPLRVLYRELRRDNIVAENPLDDIILPKTEKKRENVVEPETFRWMLAQVPAEYRAHYALAGYGGLRVGEIRGLRTELIDWDAGIIHIHWQWCEKAKALIPLKNRDRRKIPMVSELRVHLEQHLARRAVDGYAEGIDGLFLGRQHDGGPFSANHIANQATAAWDLAGYPRVTFHDLRHTYATYLIAAGVNAKAVSAMLGHSSIQITFDRYGHLFPGAENEAGVMLETYLSTERS